MRSTAETVGATDVMCDVLFPFILAAVEPRANQGSVCMGQGPLRLVDTHAHTHTGVKVHSHKRLLSVPAELKNSPPLGV